MEFSPRICCRKVGCGRVINLMFSTCVGPWGVLSYIIESFFDLILWFLDQRTQLDTQSMVCEGAQHGTMQSILDEPWPSPGPNSGTVAQHGRKQERHKIVRSSSRDPELV